MNGQTATVNKLSFPIFSPDTCPNCGKGILPVLKQAFIIEKYPGFKYLFVAFLCPLCNEVFIAEYFLESANHFTDFPSEPIPPMTILGNGLIKKDFPETIIKCSPSFAQIYNEAYSADRFGLQQIAGPGYRRALEFLVKDYSIQCNPDQKDTITAMSLGDCIKTYISDVATEDILKKTTWIANDATHYEKKHTDFDLEDLKTLIDICVSWLDADMKRRDYSAKIRSKNSEK